MLKLVHRNWAQTSIKAELFKSFTAGFMDTGIPCSKWTYSEGFACILRPGQNRTGTLGTGQASSCYVLDVLLFVYDVLELDDVDVVDVELVLVLDVLLIVLVELELVFVPSDCQDTS